MFLAAHDAVELVVAAHDEVEAAHDVVEQGVAAHDEVELPMTK